MEFDHGNKDMGCQAVDTKNKKKDKGNRELVFLCVTSLSDASYIADF